MDAKPGFFKNLWEGWKRIAAKIAHFQGHLLLSLIYTIVVAPIAVLFRLFGQDALAIRLPKVGPSYWVPREPIPSADKYLKKEF